MFRFLGQFVFTYLFVLVPLMWALELYSKDTGTVTTDFLDVLRLMRSFFEYVLKELPFYDIFNDVIIEKKSFNDLTFRYILNDYYMAVIQFGLFDLLRYFSAKSFYSKSFTEEPLRKTFACIRLGSAYVTWLPLIVYGAARLVELLTSLSLPMVDTVVAICFFVIAAARFSYCSDTGMIFAFCWVFVKILIFNGISCVLLFSGMKLIYDSYSSMHFGKLFVFIVLTAVAMGLMNWLEDVVIHFLVRKRKRD